MSPQADGDRPCSQTAAAGLLKQRSIAFFGCVYGHFE
jgi:hypothetical protein